MSPPLASDPIGALGVAQLRADVRSMLDDDDLATEITLWSLTSSTVDLETGVVTRTSDDDTVSALRRTATVEETTLDGTQLEPEDRIYLVDQADLTKSDLQTVDRLKDDGDVLEVFEFAADPLGWVWLLYARMT